METKPSNDPPEVEIAQGDGFAISLVMDRRGVFGDGSKPFPLTPKPGLEDLQPVAPTRRRAR